MNPEYPSASRIRIAGAAIAAVAVAALLAAACGGGAKAKQTGTPAAVAAATVAEPTAASAGLKTPIAISPGQTLTQEDLDARGAGEPGRGDFTGDRLIIPKIGIDAPFSYKVVANPGGQMPNPDGPTDVAYYDFSQWPLKGGLPGKGGNVVLAGHVDYIHYGPAVFWRLHELEPGDVITVRLKDGGEVTYQVEFNKVLESGESANWDGLVAATADESITLITCGGEFEAGHYNNRQIVWGRKV
jgi:LPXTG-site transpeptidase (sortase) family protein